MFATTFMRSWVDFDYITLALQPMFLFSATFFPISTYPDLAQWPVQATPLYHGVALERALMLGEVGPGILWHVLTLVVLGGLGVVGAARRLEKPAVLRPPRCREPRLTGCVPIARAVLVVTVRGMPYPSDLNDDQWALLEPVFNAPGKRGRKHGDDLRTVVDAMLYIVQTGCQWRYLPESFGAWTRVWSRLRRWSRNGTWARALTVLHATARQADGRAEAGALDDWAIDTHLARGASNGGFTFHDRGAPPAVPWAPSASWPST